MLGQSGWRKGSLALAFAEDHGAAIKEGGTGDTAPQQGFHAYLSEKHQDHISQRSQTYDLHGSAHKISEWIHSMTNRFICYGLSYWLQAGV